jgi:hypothetical protein
VRKKNLEQRIKEKIDEMGGPAVVRRKMGIVFPSGMKIDSKLMRDYKEEKK